MKNYKNKPIVLINRNKYEIYIFSIFFIVLLLCYFIVLFKKSVKFQIHLMLYQKTCTRIKTEELTRSHCKCSFFIRTHNIYCTIFISINKKRCYSKTYTLQLLFLFPSTITTFVFLNFSSFSGIQCLLFRFHRLCYSKHQCSQV